MTWIIVIACIIAYAFIGLVVFFVTDDRFGADVDTCFMMGLLWPILPLLTLIAYALYLGASIMADKISK